jgi:acyl transferase domain-containing protein
VGALYLKRLPDAIRDKDLVRGVIRTSAVNTNGKVDGMGITFPNEHGQERVLRHAYERANLDPNKTAYLECHGTGTPTGDPIEVKAVARGMNDTRSRDKPLILGAAKANIGHSEAASGIFATMKAALMTEKGEIPGVHGFKKLNPAIKDKEWNVRIATDLMPWPEEFDVRRASVSSFGYGGTNAHLVVEAVDSLCSWYEHGEAKTAAAYTYDPASMDRPFLVTMSAHDPKTLTRNISAHQDIASDYYLPDLAYTLNEKRTQFPGARGYTIAWPGHETEAFAPTSFTYGFKLSLPKGVQPGIGFVLTGQGAQWARMGCETMRRFPRFAETIDALDRVLQRAVEPQNRPHWTLRQILEAPAESSLVSQPEISQPACTAIQVAVIDLFASWGIRPAVTVGHSSGEIAAAYAAGRISAPEAILAAYFRGMAVAHAAPVGTMLAVGLGAGQVQEYLDFLPPDIAEHVWIACENSPGSATLSGTEDDILAVKTIMDDFGIFARHLKTGKAYHSSHMDDVAPLYEQLYSQANANLAEVDLAWRQPMAGMVSSVTGSKVDQSQKSIGISYWCDNLRGRVRFDTAVQSLCRDPEFANVKVLVEIGPHTALKGPVEQIMAENSFDLEYVGSLVRGKDDAVLLLKTAGELYLRGLQVKLAMVNCLNPNRSSRSTAASGISTKSGARSQGRCLVDLPPYQWNYDRQHWNEPRAMADLRTSKHPRHDLLGRRIFGLSSNAPTWKNVLRLHDVAWFPHHTLGTDVVFPAAAHVSLAIEALLQQLDLEPVEASGVRLANVDIRKALVVPDSDDGIEVHTRLEKDRSDDGWYTFTVESVTEHEGSGLWTLHTTGKIRREQSLDKQGGVSDCPYTPIQLHQQVAPKRWYRSLERVGFRYGPSFRTMTQYVRANGKDRWASAGIKVYTKQTELESRYMLHPSTIDGCIHAVVAAVHRGLLKEMPWGVVPINIEEMSVTFPEMDLNNDGHCFAWVDDDPNSSRHFSANVQLFAGSGGSSRCIMDMRNLRIVSYEAAVPPASVESGPRESYRRVQWREWDTTQEQLRSNTDAKGSRGVCKITVLVQNNDYPLPSSALSNALGASPAFLPGFTLETLQGSDTIIIDDEEGSVLAHATEKSWASLQKVLLQSGKPIVWVTRGANQGESVNSGLPQGFLRAVRSEAPTTRICLVDADKQVSTDAVAALIQYQLNVFEGTVRRDDTDLEPQQDVEFWLTSDSRILVPRLEPHEALNRLAYGQEQEYTTEVMLGDKPYRSKLIDDQVVWEMVPENRGLDPLEVEIQVQLAEFTTSNLSARAEGGGIRIVTGTIIRTGSGLDDAALNGCAAAACTDRIPSSCFMDTHIITSAFAVLGDKHADSMGDLPSSLSQLSKAVDSLGLTMNSAHELNGQHVIIVAEAAASPFEKVVTKLAVHLGFQVSTVVNSKEDRGEMRRLVLSANMAITTGRPGVELVQDIWQAMPARSTFVFGSDTPVEAYSPLDAKPLARGVLLRTCGRDPKSSLETSLALLNRFRDLAHSSMPMTVVDVQELSNSGSVDLVRRSMVDTDKTGVLRISYGQSKVKVKPTTQRAQFAPDGAYLLVGCLGGLGRSLTTWMLERGCRNFIFLARSGATKPEAADVVSRLTASGASVQVFSVDASDEKAVSDVVQRVSRRLPIRGVVHAAMVLRDALYGNMTFSDYQAALRPKKQGALALHMALADTPLDFFLMTSSISGVLGNPGQANYCAANSFLDFLALHRRQSDLAACSIALPMVEDVGVVAENAAVAEALARKMPFGINEKEMLTAFEAAILHGQPSPSYSRDQDVALGDVQLVVGLDTDAMLQAMEDDQVDLSDSFWHRDARMSSVRTSLETKQKAKGASSSGQGSERRSFAASLDGLTKEEVLQALGTHMVERCARILGSEPDTFQLDGRSLGNHGVDSMIGVQLQRWLFTEFGLQVSVTTLSDPKTTFAGLARTVAGHLGTACG